jgi:WhiB family redox-sensing transcriptional regulator
VSPYDPKPVIMHREPGGWHEQAACRGLDPDLFFPERGDDARAARAVCATCPLDSRIGCLNEALDLGSNEDGVRAGLVRKERNGMHGRPREQVIAQYVMRGMRDAEMPAPPPVRVVPVNARPIAHGTIGGYQTHINRGVEPCDECRAANARYKTARSHMRLVAS